MFERCWECGKQSLHDFDLSDRGLCERCEDEATAEEHAAMYVGECDCESCTSVRARNAREEREREVKFQQEHWARVASLLGLSEEIR